MITEALLSVVVGLVEWIVSITPTFGVELDLDLAGFFEDVGENAQRLNGWFPVATLAICIGILLAVQAITTVWGFVLWLYHQFWGSS